MTFDFGAAREWANKDAALGGTRDQLLAALDHIKRLEEQLETAHETLTDVVNVLGSWLPSESSEALRKRVERVLSNPASEPKEV